MMTRFILFFALLFIASCGVEPENQTNSDSKTTTANEVQASIPKLKRGPVGNISASLQDRNGVLWFVSSGSGVYRFDGNVFVNYTEKDGLCSDYVNCICEASDGIIWLGTSDGICTYDGTKFTDVIINIPGDTCVLPNRSAGHEFKVDQYEFPAMEDAVWDILQDRNGKLWFGTYKGIFCFDGTTYSHFTVTDGVKNTTNLALRNIEHLFEDSDGNIWFGGRLIDGALKYDGKSLSSYDPANGYWAWPLIQDRSGKIWFSNWGGAYAYDGKSFTNYFERDTTMNDVTCILEDRTGNIWFTCDDKNVGVCRYDGKAIEHFTNESTAMTGVWSMLEDRDGNIWFGTRNNGLFKYDGKSFASYSD